MLFLKKSREIKSILDSITNVGNDLEKQFSRTSQEMMHFFKTDADASYFSVSVSNIDVNIYFSLSQNHYMIVPSHHRLCIVQID